MDRNHRPAPVAPLDESPPSEAWLFAQLVLGKPIPRVISPQARARAKAPELERLAPYSSRHADELRQLKAAEAKAAHDREVLQWAAGISTTAANKLCAVEQGSRRARSLAPRGTVLRELQRQSDGMG